MLLFYKLFPRNTNSMNFGYLARLKQRQFPREKFPHYFNAWWCICWRHYNALKIESPFTRESRPMTMKLWEPKRSLQWPSQNTSKTTQGALKCGVKSSMTMPSTNTLPMNSHSHGVLTHDKYNESMIMTFQSATVSLFCVRPTSKKWFLKAIQVTMKHDPVDTM